MAVDIVPFLLDPRSYSDRAATVEQIETHISRVFLLDEVVFKLKKPVRFEFLDFSTPELRRTACLDELRLNRRLAPHVYLAVVAVTRERDGELRIAGTGEPIDWLVKMRRLPSNATLEAALLRGGVAAEDLERLSALLAPFYRDAPAAETDPRQYRSAIDRHVRANLAALAADGALDQTLLRRVHAGQLALLLLEPELFDQRVHRGRVIDGHGDLRPEHVVLTDPPVVFDCVEFNSEFRRIDVADELGFLDMECRQLGNADVGRELWERYAAAAGDYVPERLLAFYRAYRACVRAKVSSLRAAQLSGDPAGAELRLAARYLELADLDARGLRPPMLLAVGGLMGTGKSTLARRLADLFAATLLQTDAVRRELFPAPSAPAAYGAGLYADEAREQVYAELFRRAGSLLAAGQPVVLDATFLTTASRGKVQALAAEHGALPALFRCECPADVARERIARRKGGPSDARPELYEIQQSNWQPDPPGLAGVSIDTTAAPEVQQQGALKALRGLST